MNLRYVPLQGAFRHERASKGSCIRTNDPVAMHSRSTIRVIILLSDVIDLYASIRVGNSYIYIFLMQPSRLNAVRSLLGYSEWMGGRGERTRRITQSSSTFLSPPFLLHDFLYVFTCEFALAILTFN